jgi:glycosyltransferase involved in cell wall biosynthesis
MADSRLQDLSPPRPELTDVADAAGIAALEAIRRRARADATGAPEGVVADLPFRSFWMGGYEGADHVNGAGVALDMARANGHLDRLDEDYERAAALGLRTVRESIGWRLTETAPGRFDLSRPRRIAQAARRHGLQVVWTLMHYGTPADVDLRDDGLIERYARFAACVADALGPLVDEPPVYNPINEIGFLAWAASETALMHPYQHRHPAGTADSTASSGYDMKRRLVRAALAGIQAMRAIDRRARFLHIEPVVHVVAPVDRPDLQPLADTVRDYQWQAWDLLAGLAEPELGGSPAALDLLGVNHYHSGQWEVGTEDRLWWHRRDPRRRALASQLGEVWRRYGRPMVIAETGHVGVGRSPWLHEVADEVARARAAAVPVGGICLYPLVDRPDWNEPDHWHHSGLWGVAPAPAPSPPSTPTSMPTSTPTSPTPSASESASMASAAASGAARPLRRLLHLELADALADWQQRLPQGRGRLRRNLIVLTDGRWNRLSGCLVELLRHLSIDRRVIVVEAPPAADDADATATSAARALDTPAEPDLPAPPFDRIAKGPRLEVLAARTGAGAAPLDGPRVAAAVRAYLAAERVGEADLWFAAPLADAQAWIDALGVRLGHVAYHCDIDWNGMAPEAWRQREAPLLRRADLVVTSSSLLAERLGALHPNVHWLPDAVDAERHAPERLAIDCEESEAVRRALAPIGTPRFAAIGAVDRTLDLRLVEALAVNRPEWQIAMVGRIDPAIAERLPQRPNLHWLGRQAARRLPWFIAGCDVGLLPHAENGHPRSLCPQPLLEWLAAGKPVVATAIPDLVSSFGSCVRIASDPVSFVDACTAALDDSASARAARARRGHAVLETRSWAANAQRVRWLLDRAER